MLIIIHKCNTYILLKAHAPCSKMSINVRIQTPELVSRVVTVPCPTDYEGTGWTSFPAEAAEERGYVTHPRRTRREAGLPDSPGDTFFFLNVIVSVLCNSNEFIRKLQF